MTTPDIRVIFRPEGQKDVINALRQIRKESEVAARGSSAAFDPFARKGGFVGLFDKSAAEAKGFGTTVRQSVTPALGELGLVATRLIPILGIAGVTGAFIGLTRSALNNADEVSKSSQKIGETAENYSALAFGAALADVATSDLTVQVSRLQRTIGQLRDGSAEQVDAFEELSLTARDFDGLTPVRQLELIAKRLARVKDESQRTRLALDIFGRGGAKLIPLLNEIAERGFDAIANDAQRAGVIIGGDLAKQAEKANDSMKVMQLQVRGLATQFVSGLAPVILQVMTDFQNEVREGGSGSLKEFGEQTGVAIKRAIGWFRILTAVVGATFGTIGDLIASRAAALAALMRGDFMEAIRINIAGIGGFADNIKKGAQSIDAEFRRMQDSINRKPVEIEVNSKLSRGSVNKFEGDIEAQTKKAAELLNDITKRAAEKELKTLADLAKKRAGYTEQSIEAEKRLADARALSATNDAAAQQKLVELELASLNRRLQSARDLAASQINIEIAKTAAIRAQIERQFGTSRQATQVQAELAKQTAERQSAIAKEYYDELNRLQADYLSRYKASKQAIIAIDKEIADNRREGESLFRSLRIGTLSEVEQRAARIRDAEAKTEALRKAAGTGDIENARRLRGEITALAGEIARASGTGIDRNESINIGERIFNEANVLLEAALLQQKAVEVGNAEKAARAIADIGAQIRLVQSAIDEITRQQIGLNVVVGDETLRAVARQIGDFLARTPFQITIQPTVAAPGTTSGSIPGFSEGGRLGGYSPHPRADNMIFAGTAGEFIQPVRAVNHYGPQFMEDLRNLRVPKFADGGMLGGGPGDAGGERMELAITINGRGLGSVFGARDTVRQLADALREVG